MILLITLAISTVLIGGVFIIFAMLSIGVINFFKRHGLLERNRTDGYELILLLIAVACMYIWYTDNSVSLLAIEWNILSKLGVDISFDNDVIIFLGVFFFAAILGKLTPWLRATYSGCVSSVIVSTLLAGILPQYMGYQISQKVAMVVVIVAGIVFMVIGFHRRDYWIGQDKDVAAVIVSVIPAIMVLFITACTVYTVMYGEMVVNNLSYGNYAMIWALAIYGVGVILYFCFRGTYRKNMEKLASFGKH